MRFLLLLLLASTTVSAHPGALDQHGGHTDRRTGNYHCHRDPCLSHQRQNDAALQEAAQEQRPFSLLYDRADWPHWLDDDGDCRDTRAEILIRTSRVAVTFRDTKHCVVQSGEWLDPYSGRLIYQANDLDIDHLVPLKHAHGHGGSAWPASQRRQFANDPDNLVPVSAALNRAKGSSSPDQWRPPNRGYWCEYGQRWQDIKQRYALMVTDEEKAAVDELLGHCPVVGTAP